VPADWADLAQADGEPERASVRAGGQAVIEASEFCAELDRRNIGVVTGVPCSYFAGPLRLLERQPGRYVPAANEGAALAIASGAELAGTRAAVLIQNSGFGNLINPLTSLALPFGIAPLVFMSLRGWPDPRRDEPQHAVMGAATQALLDVMQVPHWMLPSDPAQLAAVLDLADAARSAGRPAFLLVPKGTIVVPVSAADPAPPQPGLTRRDALQAVLAELAGLADDVAVVATTGCISRELYEIGDRSRTFYMQGSMGHALGLALGAAMAQPQRRVVVVDGDGAVLMHLGTAATAGALQPPRLVHVVLDNAAYESTGGQASSSPAVDWPGLGLAVGYRSAAVCGNATEFVAALRGVVHAAGPHLVVARIVRSSGVAPARVTSGLAPADLRARFRRAIDPG
jgi:phosphonopyruvate decarboxylase